MSALNKNYQKALRFLGLRTETGELKSFSALKKQSKATKNSDNYPFLHYHDDYNIRCKDGMLRLIECEGINPDNFSGASLAKLKKYFAEFIADSLSTDVVLYQLIMRRRCDEIKADKFVNPVAAKMDNEYRSMLYQTGWKDSLVYALYVPYKLSKRMRAMDVYTHKALLLEDIAYKLEKQLPEYNFSSMKNVSEDGERSPTLEFLMAYSNFCDVTPVAYSPFNDISLILGLQTIYTKNTVFQQTNTDGKKVFGKILSVRNWPHSTHATIFDALKSAQCQYNITQIFSPINSDIALEKYDIELKRRTNMEDVAETLNQQINEAREELASGVISMGKPAVFVSIQAETQEQLTHYVQEATTALKHAGITPQIKDWWNLDLAIYAMIPANLHMVHSPENISNLNFASFAMPSVRSYPKETHYPAPWDKPIAIVKTQSGTLSPFSWLDYTGYDDLPNVVITGDSGQGKTTLATFMLSQSTRLGAKAFYLDKDKGAKIPIMALGGQYYEIKAGASFINPLMLELDEENLAFIKRFIQILAGDNLAASHVDIINDVVNRLSQYSVEERKLSTVAQLVRSHGIDENSLFILLKPWFGEGEYAYLFDHSTLFDFKNDITGVDITTALNNENITTPVVFVAFHIFERLLDGTPTQIFIDEGWQALDHPQTAYKIKDSEKTIRKKQGALIFLTQDPDDVVNCDIYAAIKNQTKTFITFPKSDASEGHAKLGFRKEDLSLIRSLPENKRLFVARQGNRTSAYQLDLSDCPYSLAVVSCNKKKLNKAEPLMEKHKKNWFEYYLLEEGVK